MGVTRAEAVLRDLQKGRRGGTYFLFGDQELLKERLAASIVAAHLDPGTRDFNLDELRGGELTAETLASVMATPPMMAQWRVVVVREAQALAGAARMREAVEQHLIRPIDGLVLILLVTIPERSTAQFYRRLEKEAVSVELSSLPENDLPAWLMDEAEARGFELELDAARAVAAAVGGELGVLARELDKLRDYLGERTTATVADAEAVVGVLPRQDRWAWFDLVGEGHFAEARRTAAILLDGSETAVGLVIGLGTHFLRLALAVHGGPKALSAEVSWPKLANRINGQARNWTPATIDRALEDLLRADRLAKSASLGDERIIDELLLRLEARALPAARS